MSVCSVLFLFVSAESHQVLAQLLDTLLVIGTQLPESPAVRQRLIEVACKVTNTFYIIKCSVQIQHYLQPKQQNSSMLFVCFILLALVWHVFRGEEQVSAASRMSRHGGLSSDQRQRGSGHIVRFVPQYIYLAELWLGLSLYKCTMCACSETVSCVLNALKCME